MKCARVPASMPCATSIRIESTGAVTKKPAPTLLSHVAFVRLSSAPYTVPASVNTAMPVRATPEWGRNRHPQFGRRRSEPVPDAVPQRKAAQRRGAPEQRLFEQWQWIRRPRLLDTGDEHHLADDSDVAANVGQHPRRILGVIEPLVFHRRRREHRVAREGGIAPRIERRLDARGSQPVRDVTELHVGQAAGRANPEP